MFSKLHVLYSFKYYTYYRNQYIDLMNMSRSSKRFGFFRRSGKELLPVKPVDTITILPWWIVQLGFVTEEDMKFADKAEVIYLFDISFFKILVFSFG